MTPVRIEILDDHDHASRRAARRIAPRIRRKPGLLLGLATGETPTRAYAAAGPDARRPPVAVPPRAGRQARRVAGPSDGPSRDLRDLPSGEGARPVGYRAIAIPGLSQPAEGRRRRVRSLRALALEARSPGRVRARVGPQRASPDERAGGGAGPGASRGAALPAHAAPFDAEGDEAASDARAHRGPRGHPSFADDPAARLRTPQGGSPRGGCCAAA